MRESKFLKILANRNFVKVWFAQNISLICAFTLNFVLIGKIFAATQSTVAVGFYLFFHYLPTIILGPFVGVFIDNWNKKKIFLYSNLLQSLIALLYFGAKDKIWPIYCIVLIYSFCDEFYFPAVGASLPTIVGKEYLPIATYLFFITGQGSTIIGSLVGGLMLKFLKNPNLIYIIISLLLLIAALLTMFLPSKLLRGTKKLKFDFTDLRDLSKTLDLKSFWSQTKEGYVFINHEPMVLFPILLLAGLQSMVGMAAVILPSLSEMLQIEFADSAIFIIIPAILGALLGGWIVDKKIATIRKNNLILAGLYFLGIDVLALAVLTRLLIYPIFFAMPIILTIGLGYVLVLVPLQTLIHENTPFDVRGRVFGVLSTIVTLSAVFPMLITTTLADLLGIRSVLIIIGLGILFFTAISHQQKDRILSLNNSK